MGWRNTEYLEKIQIQLNTKEQSLEFMVEVLKWREERRKEGRHEGGREE